jgi:hypothetical protein
MFVTRGPRGAKPQVKGAQGLADRPNPLADWPHFESVQAETSRRRYYVGLQGYPIPESQYRLGGVAGRQCGWPPGRPSPPNQLN